MNEKTLLCEKAAKHFLERYNCAQSVLLTMFEHWNCESELVPKIATAFGGGIGMCGSVCGALTGGVMAIGIRFGANEPSAKKRLKAYRMARKLYEQFEKEHGSVFCRKLIGYDLTNSDERKKARKSKVFQRRCTDFVRKTVEMLIELAEN